jgi:hypothetical protein
MKAAKPQLPAPRKRGRPAKFNVRRPTIAARLQPAIYQRVVDAAAANRNSISTEIERRIEKSFEDQMNPDGELHDLAVRVITAFEAGGRLEDPDRPVKQWINEPLNYNRAMLGAFEALMARHPHPRYTDLIKLIYSISKRLKAVWLDMSEEDTAGQRLPQLVMTFSKRKDKNKNGQDEKS